MHQNSIILNYSEKDINRIFQKIKDVGDGVKEVVTFISEIIEYFSFKKSFKNKK